MISNSLFPVPFAGGQDLWSAVDFNTMPPHTRRMIERARDADQVRLADEMAKSAALSAQLVRATAIASEFQLQLDQKAGQ